MTGAMTLNADGVFAHVHVEYRDRGQLSPRTDSFAFGIIAIELLTGKGPKMARGLVDDSLFEELPGLQSLFAQHNQFQTMSALEGLCSLLGLEKLALHGCPLHERLKRRRFRLGVLSLVPSVKQLDLTTVSPLEMADARQAQQHALSTRRASIAGTLKRPVVRARELGRVTTLLQRRVRQE